MIPMMPSDVQAITAESVIVDTAVGKYGFSLLTIKYMFAMSFAIKAIMKICQQVMPAFPCFHVINPTRGRKMADRTIST